MYTVYKYCCNGEVGFTTARNLDDAKMALMQKYLKKFGSFNLTDIKPVKAKGEKNGTVNKFS